ncbi:MAG: hypothetical protein HQK99_14585 [Nitrospirae bacterium]|nr:hypothetical protein [Nitrospirota bacterium]
MNNLDKRLDKIEGMTRYQKTEEITPEANEEIDLLAVATDIHVSLKRIRKRAEEIGDSKTVMDCLKRLIENSELLLRLRGSTEVGGGLMGSQAEQEMIGKLLRALDGMPEARQKIVEALKSER